MFRIPLKNLSSSHRFYIIRTRDFGINTSIYWNDCDATFIKHWNNNILNESSTCLIKICLKIQTIVKGRINARYVSTIFINFTMSNIQSSYIQSNSIKYGSNDCTFISSSQSRSVWTIGVPRACIIITTCGIFVHKSIPAVLDSVNKTHFDFTSCITNTSCNPNIV